MVARELVVGENQRLSRRIPLGAVGRNNSKSHRVSPIKLSKKPDFIRK